MAKDGNQGPPRLTLVKCEGKTPEELAKLNEERLELTLEEHLHNLYIDSVAHFDIAIDDFEQAKEAKFLLKRAFLLALDPLNYVVELIESEEEE